MIGGEAQPSGLSALCPACQWRHGRISRSIAKASTTGTPVVKAARMASTPSKVMALGTVILATSFIIAGTAEILRHRGLGAARRNPA